MESFTALEGRPARPGRAEVAGLTAGMLALTLSLVLPLAALGIAAAALALGVVRLSRGGTGGLALVTVVTGALALLVSAVWLTLTGEPVLTFR